MTATLDLDTCNAVADTSRTTLRGLAGMIAASRSVEQMVYRETELDEVWRLLVVADDPRAGEIHAIHDLIADAAGPAVAAVAAARLRALAG